MSLASLGIADKSFELGKSVLTLSCLGLFVKLLKVDLSNIQVLGIAVGPTYNHLVPGFLGLFLCYAYMCLCVARMEFALEIASRQDLHDQLEKATEVKPLLAFFIVASPFFTAVYLGPFALGAYSIYLLWSDIVAVVLSTWALAHA